MAGSGGAPPPEKRPPPPSGANRANGAPPPGQGSGRGALPVPASGAGRGGVALPKAAAGRGSGGPGATHFAGGAPVRRPPAPALPSGGRGGPGSGPRPVASGGAAVAAAGRGAAPPRPPVSSGPLPRPAPPPHVVARPSPPSQSNVGGTVAAPRGQWEDDGYDAYGDGQHRGSSSTGGGRGYAWQSDGSAERPFLGPSGGFVEGPSDPGNRQRGGFRGHRGGRGGRGGPYRPRPPPPPVVVEQMTDNGAAKEPVLTGHAMEVVTALATIQVPENEVMADVSVDMTDRAESDRASKWARKKEKMLCYRCGDKGHFIAECVALLCDTCGKPAHDSGDCPIL
nr:translation initiation factor IF-2-like [Aegilops tauschii subsp. strangulata]